MAYCLRGFLSQKELPIHILHVLLAGPSTICRTGTLPHLLRNTSGVQWNFGGQRAVQCGREGAGGGRRRHREREIFRTSDSG